MNHEWRVEREIFMMFILSYVEYFEECSERNPLETLKREC